MDCKKKSSYNNPSPSVEFHHLQQIQVTMDAFIAGYFGRHSQNEAAGLGDFRESKDTPGPWLVEFVKDYLYILGCVFTLVDIYAYIYI